MTSRLDLLIDDIAFRFKTSNIKSVPDLDNMVQVVIKRVLTFDNFVLKRSNFCHLTKCFKKSYPKLRTIIQSMVASEVFIETQTSLDVQAVLWSDYKNYCTFKSTLSGLRQFLVTESLLNMMKNALYFTWKALFILKMFTFLSRLFGHVLKWLD